MPSGQEDAMLQAADAAAPPLKGSQIAGVFDIDGWANVYCLAKDWRAAEFNVRRSLARSQPPNGAQDAIEQFDGRTPAMLAPPNGSMERKSSRVSHARTPLHYVAFAPSV